MSKWKQEEDLWFPVHLDQSREAESVSLFQKGNRESEKFHERPSQIQVLVVL